METIWYIILGLLMGTYILLDGFDIGAGMAYLFFPDTDEEKNKITGSIRSIWDANEAWLLGFIGLLSIVFPVYYKVLFVNFGGYILLFFLFILLKIIALNLMLVFKDDKRLLGIIGFIFGFLNTMLIVFISIIFANILRGIFVSRAHTEIGFISKHFSPFSNQIGLFDWFTVLVATTIFIALMLHGLGWIVLKNSGAFNRKLKKRIQVWAFVELILFILVLIAMYILHPGAINNYRSYPFLFLFPVLSLISLFGLIGIRSYQGENKAFLLTTNMIIFTWISAFIALYPRFIFSLDEQQLTILNAGFDNPERFYIKWWILGVGVILLAYSILIHKYVKGENKEN